MVEYFYFSQVVTTDVSNVDPTKTKLTQTTTKETLSIKIPDILFLTMDEFEKVPKYVSIKKYFQIPEVLLIL